MINELNDLMELGKVSLKWKTAPKDSNKSVPSKISDTPSQSNYTHESESEMMSIDCPSSNTGNPWRTDKENVKPNTVKVDKPRVRNHAP